MKLYTEEQLRKAIELAQECEHECGGVYFDYSETEIIEELTKIELPTYEDVNHKIQSMKGYVLIEKDFFASGAKWMIDKIKEKINETNQT